VNPTARLLFFLLLFRVPHLFASGDSLRAPRHAVSVEAFGMSVCASLNVERDLLRWSNHELLIKAGFGGIRLDNNVGRARTGFFPLSVIVTQARGPHRVETGLGATFCTGLRSVFVYPDDGSNATMVETRFRSNLLCFAHVGYRYDWAKRPFFFRIAFTPIFARMFLDRPDLNRRCLTIYPWAGAGFGLRF
jgi:hypothetical protein